MRKTSKNYDLLVDSIGALLLEARKTVYTSINKILVETYWEVGRRIVEFEQGGEEKAEYGSSLLEKLSWSHYVELLTYRRIYPKLKESILHDEVRIL